jgi:STELLO glycosyltransferases
MAIRRDVLLGIAVVFILFGLLPSLSKIGRCDYYGTGNVINKQQHDSGQHTSTATSGRVFTMQRLRSLPGDFQTKHQKQKQPVIVGHTTNSVWHNYDKDPENLSIAKCKYWATLTTIFDVTEAARKISGLKNWCLVVAGDRKGPTQYDIGNNVVFLSAEKQQKIAKAVPFVQNTPWNHFARKNIAYIFAMAHNAQLIFDFDDDNVLLEHVADDWTSLIAFTTVQSNPGQRYEVLQQDEGLTDFANNTKDGIRVLMPRRRPSSSSEQPPSDQKNKCLVFNNYNAFITNTSDAHIWPRGFPLEDISPCHRDIYEFDSCVLSTKSQNTRIAIWQSVAQIDPDVDAIYRLTRRLPVEFDIDTNPYPVVVPTGMFSPMNAQAALFDRQAAWSLFLPTTVHGRVSDIWRSYIAQALFQHMGLQVAFAGSPLVAQYRNAHDYLADYMAEEPLYERAGALVEYLSSWEYTNVDKKGGVPTTQGAMEQLYIDLYEHEIVELDDVVLVQEWIDVLNSIGYEFPPWTGTKEATQKQQVLSCAPKQPSYFYKTVALMGQFNYYQDVADVVHWARRWSTIFFHFQARGPFNSSNIETLQAYGIPVVVGADDAGFYSPMTNMASALRQYAKVPGIVGLIYAHDDMIMNLSLAEEVGVATDHTIVTQAGMSMLKALEVGLKSNNMPLSEAARRRFQPIILVSPGGKFALPDMPNRTYNIMDKQHYPNGWISWQKVIPPLGKAVSSDERMRKHLDEQGTVPLLLNSYADFAYVPVAATEVFAEVAEVMAENGVFLEGGFHVASSISARELNLTPSVMGTCVARNSKVRVDCLKDFVGLYHALKLGTMGKQLWDEYFDIIISL